MSKASTVTRISFLDSGLFMVCTGMDSIVIYTNFISLKAVQSLYKLMATGAFLKKQREGLGLVLPVIHQYRRTLRNVERI